MTDFDTEWDVDKYYDDTEPEEHWELRKQFLLTHQKSYPEDYLVALSKVFTNVEFMGCSYGKEVMALVSDLSEDIAKDYRKKKSTKLQRTFVKASDAAESKFSVNKKSSHIAMGATSYTTVNTNSINTGIENTSKLKIIDKVKCQPGPRGRLVFIKHETNERPWITLSKSASIAGISVSVEQTGKMNANHKRGYILKLDGETVADGFADSEKEAKEIVGQKAYEKLQETCFTIERKLKPIDNGETVEKYNNQKQETPENSASLGANSVGAKLMKLMGWGGKGLGKDESGREDCVEVKEQVSRAGLGSTSSGSANMNRELEKYISDYAQSNKTHNLVFSAEYSSDERKFIHRIASKYNLKSRSYGKDSERQLVISRKVTVWELVRDLLLAGGSFDQYVLMIPTNFK